ncbi:MAG TPA: phospholipase D family protein [Burkholderiaceae bacterium]|nr:phospholipase D family protein [Burkholderiaceae bacterium]
MTIEAIARFIGIPCCARARRSCQIAGRGAGHARSPLALHAAGLAALLALLGGCATLPAPLAKTESHAQAPAGDGGLAAIAKASTPPGDGLSGFRLLPLGPFALDARLQLIDRAAHTLEVQYYVFDNDPTGRRMMSRLLAAAQRGVRVRLLVDDLYTVHTDPLLRLLADQKNLEVRLFNPFCCARESSSGRFTVALFDLYRLNHRMHNKLLVADGLVAIAGGRNVADEYFMLNMSGNFVDMDALVMGTVVPQLQAIFDRYWNSDVVWPIQALVPGERALPVDDFARLVAAGPPPPPLAANDALGYGPVSDEFDSGRIGLIWAPARAFADPPNKLEKMSPEEASEMSVSKEVRMQIWSAKHDLVITSPYMIPGPMGITAFEALGERKVKTVVVTNSLAATDEPLVHTGYARYRPRLLASGVDLYEISPERTRRTKRLGMFGSSFGRLHAKTAIVDLHTVFIGSMNLDPRSDTQNTELGIFVESPALAKELLRIVNISKLQSAYRVRIGHGGQLEWLTMDNDHEMVLTEEPEATFWMRVQNMLVAPFVPEQLL